PQVRLAEERRFELLRGCPQHAFQPCWPAFTGIRHRPRTDGVQSPTPLPPAARLWIRARRGAADAPRAGNGVQSARRLRGAVAPTPSMELSGEPSAASARGRAALPAAAGPSSWRAGIFFCALGPVWRLTGLLPGRAW